MKKKAGVGSRCWELVLGAGVRSWCSELVLERGGLERAVGGERGDEVPADVLVQRPARLALALARRRELHLVGVRVRVRVLVRVRVTLGVP